MFSQSHCDLSRTMDLNILYARSRMSQSTERQKAIFSDDEILNLDGPDGKPRSGSIMKKNLQCSPLNNNQEIDNDMGRNRITKKSNIEFIDG